jgi:hypothetical protein
VHGCAENGSKNRVMKRLIISLVLAGATLVALPSTASAQIPAESWGANDECRDASPGGIKAPKPRAFINLGVNGSGSVAIGMYGTGAECVLTRPQTAPPNSRFEIQTVCEFHCGHNHTSPYPWTVQLVPAASPGAFFVGWTANCTPIKVTPRSWCIVRMNEDHTVTADFDSLPDTQAPTPSSASAAAAGPYSADVSWTRSSDARLAGYDIYQGSTHIARTTAATTSFKVENLFCETNYTFRVDAYDWSGNSAPGSPAVARTGPCIRSGGAGARPNTILHVKPPRSTRARGAFFHFGTTGSVRATRYQCKLDRGRWRSCPGRTGKRYRSLRRGYHTFYVRAGNANGFDRTPARWRWRIR